MVFVPEHIHIGKILRGLCESFSWWMPTKKWRLTIEVPKLIVPALSLALGLSRAQFHFQYLGCGCVSRRTNLVQLLLIVICEGIPWITL